MIKRLLIITLISVLFLTPLVALAASIENAQYYAVIQISNNSTATTNVATIASVNTTNLIDGDYLNASANNCAIRTSSGADIPFQPGYTPDGYPWCIWVPSIGDNDYQSDILYTANSTGGLIRYFPGSGGMTTPDDDTLELGDNFTIEQKGWVDTTAGSNKDLVRKTEAFGTFVSETVTGNITSFIWVDGGGATEDLLPNATGNETGITTLVGAATHWQATRTDDDNTSYVSTGNDTEERDFYNLDDTGLRFYDIITSVNVTAKGYAAAGGRFARPWLLLDGNYIEGTEVNIGTGLWQVAFNETLARPGGGTWTYEDLDDLQVGIGLRDPVANDVRCSYIKVVVSYDSGVGSLQVTATEVSSDNHTIKTEANGLFFGIDVDQTNSDSWPIPDNLVLNAPLYHTGLNTSPFTTKDVNEHSCTVTGATWTSDGYDFDGTNYITVPDDPVFNMVTQLTALIWVNTDDLANTRVSLSKYGATGNKREWQIDAPLGTGEVDILFGDPNDGTYESRERTDSVYLTNNTWLFIAFTFNAGTVVIYVNGDAVASTTIGVNPATLYNGAADIVIGSDNDHSAYWKGLIGEAQIYDRALDPGEIKDNYDATKWKYDASASYSEYELVGAGVLTNSENWTFVENDSMLYLEEHKVSVNGTLAQHIVWEYDNVFTDLSVNDNDATPTFRTASSDADVSAELVSFQPIAEAKAPDYVLGVAPDFIDPGITGNVTGTFTTTPGTGTFPLALVITAIANATKTPPQLPLLIIACFVILAVSLSFSATMRRYGSGSVFIKVLVICAVMGCFVGIENFAIDFWMIFVFLVIGIAITMASKQAVFS